MNNIAASAMNLELDKEIVPGLGHAENAYDSLRKMGAVSTSITLFILLSALLAIYYLRRARQVRWTSREFEGDGTAFDAKTPSDSPFLAYLGHNAVTEAVANDPSNTSNHAIERLLEKLRLRPAMSSYLVEEPQTYGYDDSRTHVLAEKWRRHSYPDSPNRQVSFDRVQVIRQEGIGRSWQRRTIHACGV